MHRPSAISKLVLKPGGFGGSRLNPIIAELGNECGAGEHAQNHEDSTTGDSPEGANVGGSKTVEHIRKTGASHDHHEEDSLQASTHVVGGRALED